VSGFVKREAEKLPRKLRTAIFYLPETYAAMRERDYFDLAFLPLFAAWDREGFPAFGGVALPPVVTDGEREKVLSRMKTAAEKGVKWALLENPAQLALCREAGLLPFGDFRFNITNREAMTVWQQAGLLGFVLSPELTLPQLRDLAPGSAVVYGRVPLMITERCFVKENGGCDRCGKFAFTDRTGAKFPVLREYPHRNLIFNSLPTYMGDREKELEKYGITRRHFIFSVENAKEADGVVAAWRTGAPMGGRRIVKDNGA
jgi:putative protease